MYASEPLANSLSSFQGGMLRYQQEFLIAVIKAIDDEDEAILGYFG